MVKARMRTTVQPSSFNFNFNFQILGAYVRIWSDLHQAAFRPQRTKQLPTVESSPEQIASAHSCRSEIIIL